MIDVLVIESILCVGIAAMFEHWSLVKFIVYVWEKLYCYRDIIIHDTSDLKWKHILEIISRCYSHCWILEHWWFGTDWLMFLILFVDNFLVTSIFFSFTWRNNYMIVIETWIKMWNTYTRFNASTTTDWELGVWKKKKINIDYFSTLCNK